MILLELQKHQYKEKVRSTFWQKNIWMNILLVILSLYLILCVASIGYFADEILQKVYKDRNVVQSFTGLVFYYFAFDLIIRILFLKVPVISIKPYLTLPIKKSIVLHYPLLKTIPGIMNILALCLVLPFFFKAVMPTGSIGSSAVWLATILSVIIINNFTGFLLKKYFAKRPWLVFLTVIIIAASFFFDAKGKINIREYVVDAFIFIESHQYYIILPLMLAFFSYKLAYRMLKRNSYIEDSESSKKVISPDFSFLTGYGETGLLMQTELRMIFRNRRSKSIIWLSIIFLFYGFIFYNPEEINSGFFLLFGGFLITSAAAILYAQYYFAWESSFIDVYLSNRITTINYLKSKYWLFFFLCLVCYILTLPYGLFGHNIALINFSLFIYNLGVTSFLYIFIGLFSRSRMDLDKSQFMNYEGTGAAQWLGVIPVMGLPFLIFLVCRMTGNSGATYFILMTMGATGMIFHEHILKFIVKFFYKNKYKMAEAFRKK